MFQYPTISEDLEYLQRERLKPRKLWELSQTCDPRGIKEDVILPTDVAFLTEDHFIVADSEGHRLLLLDDEGDLVSVLADRQVWPNCVAVTREGKIVVTDRQKKLIKMYDINGECISTWGENCNENVNPFADEIEERPSGVAVNSKGQIIVSDTSLNIIKVFAPDGKLVRKFGTKGSGINEFNLPFYVAVDGRDNIYVSDNMNYCIKVFDAEGNFKFRIGSGQDWGQRQFHCPYGVAVDVEGKIFVVDSGNSRIGIYSPEGDFIRFVVAKADSCRSPSGVAVTDTSGILVYTESSWDYSNVKMFQLYES